MLIIILVGTILSTALAYRFYGKCIERWAGTNTDEPTPAHTRKDGVDYVPTRPSVLFGHHFSSIAGAGPIVGPIIAAAYFGWGPTWLWILVGAIFVGGVHDFGSAFMSIRTQGRSIVETCGKLVGPHTGRLFQLFAIVALLYVVIVFLDLTAVSFVNRPEVATSSGWFVLTALGFGWASRKGLASFGLLGGIFIALTYFGLVVGTVFPAPELPQNAWAVVVLLYCLLAAILPVDRLMQPRDFLSATFLYAIMLLGCGGLLIGGGEMQLPVFTSFTPENFGALMPFLFITVACGACSGFHSMVASGTTSKQVDKESHLRPVAYGSMLVEGILAALALASVGVLGGMAEGGPVGTFAQGVATFFGALGIPHEFGVTFAMLAISTFLLTTLDTCTRLCRFLLEELTGLRGTLQSRLLLTVAVLALAALFAFQTYDGQPAWKAIWPLFGATNQLLAALALVTFVVFQRSRGRPFLFALVPALIMVLMPLWALASMGLSGAQPLFLRIMAAGLFLLGLIVVVMSALRWPQLSTPASAEASRNQ